MFSSLRFRLLAPIVGAALLCAIAAAIVSSYLGRRWAMEDVDRRYAVIERTLSQSNFPLTGPILRSLADLTGTELVVFGRAQVFQVASRELAYSDQRRLASKFGRTSEEIVEVDLKVGKYLGFSFSRTAQSAGARERVVVLFDRDAVDRLSRAASFLPLITGLSTVALLTAVVLLLAGRLIARLRALQSRVHRIAGGDFAAKCPEQPSDEVGGLGVAINLMTGQLHTLWQSIHRDQAAKLLHQMAGGMAHQLRNTLTGSRLAIELHSRELPEPTDEIDVALEQIRSAEDYVSRILLVGKGEVGTAESEVVDECIARLRPSLETFAKHLSIELVWDIDAANGCNVADGSSLGTAVTNLVLNALQAADSQVVVRCSVQMKSNNNSIETVSEPPESGSEYRLGQLQVEVLDDGPGVDDSIQATLFEPFVSTKPEGCGLGLATVRKSIEQLDGSVRHDRVAEQTRFTLVCQCKGTTSKCGVEPE